MNSQLYSLQVRNRFPDEWQDVRKTELTGKNGAPLFKSLNDFTDEQLLSMLPKRAEILDSQPVEDQPPSETAPESQTIAGQQRDTPDVVSD